MQSCNLVIDEIELITPNRVKMAGFMNYAGNNNNRVVFEADSSGEICNEIRGYFLKKVFKKIKSDFIRMFELDKYPYAFKQEKIYELLKDDDPIILHYNYR